MGRTERGLVWTTSPPSERELRRDGFTVTSFRDVRIKHIDPTRATTSKRSNLENAASGLLRLLEENPRIAILGLPARTAGDIDNIYSFVVEPSFRRDVTLLLGVDRSLDELDAARLTDPKMGYPWSLERLSYLAERYLRNERGDGLPPLTPIEARLLAAMRDRSLTPEVQFGIGRYRVDFAFPGLRLAVEADGRAWHDAERDAARDAHLEALGWQTLHFTGSEIHRDVRGVTDRIIGALEDRADIVVYTELPPGPRRSRWRLFLDWLLRRNRRDIAAGRAPDAPRERPIPEWKAHLDIDQRRAVDAHEGVVQVIAPAGSGKTTTMITRVQELLTRGVAANRILCTTFNRAARDELEKRLKERGISGVEVRSFHALGRSILDHEGLLRSEIGTATYGQWRRISKQAMDSVDDGVWIDAPVASELVSNYKLAEMWDPKTARRHATTPIERTAAAIYTLYEDYLESADRNDFDDLILRAVQVLQRDPDVRRRWQDRWECVLVDEYQDIEPAQELLIRLVAAPEDSIFAVGDEDQCIYAWRRASVERIVMLDTIYPGLDRVVLGTSYRCPSMITKAAKMLIANNKRRFPKEILPSPTSSDGEIETHSADSLIEGARLVASLLQDHVNQPNDVVVLARTSRLLREVVQACLEKDIRVTAPARALHATDAEETVLAYLRLVSAPQAADAADIRRSYRVPNRYLPQSAEDAVAQSLRSGRSFAEAVNSLQIPIQEDWRRPRIVEWAELCAKIASAASAADAIRTLRTDGGLDRHYSSVEQMSPHDQIEVEALDDLESRATDAGLNEFVAELETRAAALAGSEDEDAIELTTIHGAKGREWDTVILFGADVDQLPHFRTLFETGTAGELEEALEDERRLAYVAITRTRSKLIVVTSSQPSPFLREAGIVPSAPNLPTRQSVDAAKAAAEGSKEGHRTANSTSKSTSHRRDHQLQTKPKTAPTVTAKYPGRCSVCKKAIRPGDPIVRSDDHWIHERCAAG